MSSFFPRRHKLSKPNIFACAVNRQILRARAVVTLFALPLVAAGFPGPAEARNIGWPGTTLSGVECYGHGQGVGPFNYNTQRSMLAAVEAYHFTREVEQLVRGKSGYLQGDLDYTLRAYPNHHRALWAMSRYYLRKVDKEGLERLETIERSRTGTPPPECYFHRAKRLAPEDGMVSAIFGIYLHKRGKLDPALSEYERAEKLMPSHAELSYNMGLLLYDMGEFAKAGEYADKAQRLGYPLTGLQRKLRERSTDEMNTPTGAPPAEPTT